MELFSHNSDALYILAFMKCLKRFLCRVTAGCESVFEFKEGERKEQTHTFTICVIYTWNILDLTFIVTNRRTFVQFLLSLFFFFYFVVEKKKFSKRK